MDRGGRPVESLVEGCPCDGCELFAACGASQAACKVYFLWTKEKNHTRQQRIDYQLALDEPRRPSQYFFEMALETSVGG